MTTGPFLHIYLLEYNGDLLVYPGFFLSREGAIAYIEQQGVSFKDGYAVVQIGQGSNLRSQSKYHESEHAPKMYKGVVK